MEATYHCWERRKATGSNPLRQSLSGTQPGLCRAAEMTQTLRHIFLDLWERGKYKVWKNNSIFQICQRPGLSPCKLGSVRTSLFATYWFYIKVLIKIKFPTLVSVAYLQRNSVLGNCQKIHSSSSQHPHISKFLLQKVLIPSVLVPEEQKVLKRLYKAASSGKEWFGDTSPQTWQSPESGRKMQSKPKTYL